ncbi:MAG: hypothetical protein AAFO07_21295 [Bacteroidota bacterium]
MSQASTYKNLYPIKFEETKMTVPEEPNVEFSFVVKAPKAYVMDAWNLTKEKGGSIVPCTTGTAKSETSWPGITDDMERIIYVTGVGVTQVVGNLQTPEEGDWHFEWKAGAPYYKMPFPMNLIMTSVHGQATLIDGPNLNETTVKITNRHRPGLGLWFTRFAIKAAMPLLSAAAPKRFAEKKFLGPQ